MRTASKPLFHKRKSRAAPHIGLSARYIFPYMPCILHIFCYTPKIWLMNFCRSSKKCLLPCFWRSMFMRPCEMAPKGKKTAPQGLETRHCRKNAACRKRCPRHMPKLCVVRRCGARFLPRARPGPPFSVYISRVTQPAGHAARRGGFFHPGPVRNGPRHQTEHRHAEPDRSRQ